MILLIATTCRAATPQLTNIWEHNIDSQSDTSLALGKDGTIYFGTWNGRLFALKRDGTPKWVYQTRSRIEIRSSPALARDDTIYFGSRDRSLHAVSADGKRKWEFPTGGWVDSSPAIAVDGTIYFGSWDMNLYALDPAGRQQWGFKTAGPIVSSPAVGRGGVIYFGCNDRKLYALQPNGRKKWEFVTDGAVISSPAIGKDGEIYFTSVDGFLYCLNPDGKLRWKVKTGGITSSSPVLSPDGAVFLGVNEGCAIVSAEGKLVWQRGGVQLAPATPLANQDLSVTIVTGWGNLQNFDRTQTPLWDFWLKGIGDVCPVVGADGTIYVTGGRKCYALGPAQLMAKSTWPRFRGNVRNTGNIADNPGL